MGLTAIRNEDSYTHLWVFRKQLGTTLARKVAVVGFPLEFMLYQPWGVG